MHVTHRDPCIADPRFQKKQECLGDEYFWGTGSAFDEDMAACIQWGTGQRMTSRVMFASTHGKERDLIMMLLSRALTSEPCLNSKSCKFSE